jgi:Cytochrome C oxidase, cbb3-type, subunit III
MQGKIFSRICRIGTPRFLTVLGVALALGIVAAHESHAGVFQAGGCGPAGAAPGCAAPGCGFGFQFCGEPGGSWHWVRSPDEERRVIIGLYNRYCIRCHGVDGRGVWDIPSVPNFTNPRWQASRSDGQLVRIILEGRGAVMPPFRGTLTLEEGWGMARYLRTFLPGTETPRPDLTAPGKTAPASPSGAQKK